MTKITTESSPIRRETQSIYRRRAIVVELGAVTMTLRPKGLRKGFELDYESALELAMKKEGLRVAAEKRKGQVGKLQRRRSVMFGGNR
jgi:hypothetical protein